MRQALAKLLKESPGLTTLEDTDSEYEAEADYLLANGVVIEKRGEWLCVWDEQRGETDVTCSACKDTRTINGCYVDSKGNSVYFEDTFCPNCGAKNL